jgi:hypothetical protein
MLRSPTPDSVVSPSNYFPQNFLSRTLEIPSSNPNFGTALRMNLRDVGASTFPVLLL